MSETKRNFTAKTALDDRLSLLRISKWQNLDDTSLALVRRELLKSLDLAPESTRLETNHAIQEFEAEESEKVDSHHKLTKLARQLINSGLPWHAYSGELWNTFKNHPTLECAATFLEIAFVQCSSEEALEYFGKIFSSNLKASYWLLHPKLRDFIVEFVPEPHIDALYWMLAKERDETKLTGLELAFIFLRITTTSDKTACWSFFQRYQNKILSAFQSKPHFGMTRDKLIIRVGELAFRAGCHEEAKTLLQEISKDSLEAEIASQILGRFDRPHKAASAQTYVSKLENTQDWRSRLSLISSFCDTARKQGGKGDPNIESLDLIFGNLPHYIPKNIDAWRQTSELIIRNRDLRDAIPNILKLFYNQSVIYHAPEFDCALWDPVFTYEPKTEIEIYLRCVASVHKYCANSNFGEKQLWNALAAASKITLRQNEVPWNIKDVIKTATRFVSSSAILPETERSRVKAGLQFALEGTAASAEIIDQYLERCQYIPTSLLHTIASNMSNSGQSKLAKNLLLKLGSNQGFTNMDLTKLWSISSLDQSPDFAWRVATILASREALHPLIRQSWQISGERRAGYTPQSLTLQDVECASHDLSLGSKKLIRSLCVLGAKIHELNIINGSASHQLPPLVGTSTIEQSISAILKRVNCVPAAPKNVAESAGIHHIPSVAAPLAQAVISGPWLFAARIIAERLSLSSWGWNVQALQSCARAFLPYIGKDSSGKLNAKLANWLTAMDSSERSAWNALVNCSQTETQERLAIDLVKFVCRLSLILYPSHYTALKTLHGLRMSLEIIRDLESFILSEGLTTIRMQKGISSRISIPEQLKHLVTQ